MIEQGQCERCAALERENGALKKEKGELEAILHDNRFDILRTIVRNTSNAVTASLQTKGGPASTRLIDSHIAANDRFFSQHLALFELPLKTEQMQVKTENLRARTALVKVDARLKEEKIKASQAERHLKESQTRLLEAAALALERYAETGNMVDADFEVIDQLKQIGVKIPAKVSAKNQKQTNGAR